MLGEAQMLTEIATYYKSQLTYIQHFSTLQHEQKIIACSSGGFVLDWNIVRNGDL